MNSEKALTYTLIGIVVIIAVFLITRAVYEPEVVTKEEMFEDVLEGNEEYGYMHNGYAFIFDPYLKQWVTRVRVKDNLVEVPLHYGPRDVEDIPSYGNINSTFNQKEIFVTFDTNSTQMSYIAVSAAELSLNLFKGIGATPIASCTTNASECEGRPIVTCDTNVPVIYLKIDDTDAVFRDGNCVTLKGNGTGLIKSVDRFLLEWYRII